MMRRALLALPLVAASFALAAPTASADTVPSVTTTSSSADACLWLSAAKLGVCVPDNLFEDLPKLPDIP